MLLSCSLMAENVLILKETVHAQPGHLVLDDLLSTPVGDKRTVSVLLPGLVYSIGKRQLERSFPSYKFEGPDEVVVWVLGEEGLAEAIRRELERTYGLETDFTMKVLKSFGRYPSDLKVEQIRVTKISKTLASVFLRFADRTSVTLNVELSCERNVVVAKRNIKKGEVVREEDVVLERKNILGIGEPVLEITEVVGKIARRYIASGTPIERGHLERPPDAFKDQIVPAFLDTGALKVSTFVKLLENARIGERVKAMNAETGRTVTGVLLEGPTLKITGVIQ